MMTLNKTEKHATFVFAGAGMDGEDKVMVFDYSNFADSSLQAIEALLFDFSLVFEESKVIKNLQSVEIEYRDNYLRLAFGQEPYALYVNEGFVKTRLIIHSHSLEMNPTGRPWDDLFESQIVLSRYSSSPHNSASETLGA